jgi:hypothetical protein
VKCALAEPKLIEYIAASCARPSLTLHVVKDQVLEVGHEICARLLLLLVDVRQQSTRELVDGLQRALQVLAQVREGRLQRASQHTMLHLH